MSIFIALTCLFVIVNSNNVGLYSELDEVNILTSANFSEIVFGKRKQSAWIVQFYNAWCGHCRRFAPKYKKLGKDIKGWSDVISLGVVACSDSINTDICRQYEIKAYPTIKIIPPFSLPNTTNFEDLKTQELDEMKDIMAKYVSSSSITNIPKSWPKLTPLESIERIWDETKTDHKHVILIFEEDGSSLGTQLILDYLNKKNILIRRLLKESVMKYGITKVPSLYVVNRDGTYKKLAASPSSNVVENRKLFQEAINNLVNNNLPTKDKDNILRGSENVENMKKDDNVERMKIDENVVGAGDGSQENKHEDTKIKEIEKPQVYYQDLESALHYSFRQEIAIHKLIEGEDMIALQNYISVLYKYLPARDEVRKFLQEVHQWLTTLSTSVSGTQWLDGIDSLQDELTFLPEKIEWIGCAGSSSQYRGYPCSMWTLFHTLTVNAYLSEQATDAKEVLNAIQGYMKYFFGCAECSKNFLQMAETIKTDIKSKKDMVIWLWSAHNKANKRLHGDLSEDPEYPKIQFPSQDACPKCYAEDSKPWNPTWKKSKVLEFLVDMYRSENIVKTELSDRNDAKSLSYRSGIKSPSNGLDWWEKKQRNKDLEILYDIRIKKRERLFAKLAPESKLSAQRMDVNERLRRHNSSYSTWSFTGLDLGMCVMFYIICAIIVLMLYYHFTVRTKHKLLCRFLPV